MPQKKPERTGGSVLELEIPADCAGARLDRCLSRLIPGSSRAYLQKLIKDGLVTVSGQSGPFPPRYPVKAGQHIEVLMPGMEETGPLAEEFDFPVLFEGTMMRRMVIAAATGPVRS